MYLNQIMRKSLGRQRWPPGKETMGEFNYDEYWEAIRRTAQIMDAAFADVVEAMEKLVEKINSFENLKKLEGEQEDTLEENLRGGSGNGLRDARGHCRRRRSVERCRDWRRAALPSQKSYARRWKCSTTRKRRDFRRRRT